MIKNWIEIVALLQEAQRVLHGFIYEFQGSEVYCQVNTKDGGCQSTIINDNTSVIQTQSAINFLTDCAMYDYTLCPHFGGECTLNVCSGIVDGGCAYNK